MRQTAYALIMMVAPALAQERPPIMPTRDVAVTYRVTGEGAPTEMRMAWLTAQGLMRVDMPGGQGFMVVNSQAGSGFMAMPQMRTLMELPAGAGGVSNFARASQTARFTREGNDRVANTACTIWRVEDRGDAARICTTTDGVTLRASSGGGASGRGSMEATLVEYGAQDAGRFARPQGFQVMQMPGGAAPTAPPGAPAGSGGSFPGPRGSALPPPGVTR